MQGGTAPGAPSQWGQSAPGPSEFARARNPLACSAEDLGAGGGRHQGTGAVKLASWAENNVGEGLTVFDLGLTEAQYKRLRTANSLENLNQQIRRRRTRVARPFPNEDTLLRLARAVLIKISEEWETGRRYLPRDDA